jgi:hypothetical protein
VERRKCPIEGLYWTKRVGGEEEMSDRRALSDKTVEGESNSVQYRKKSGKETLPDPKKILSSNP